MFRKEVDVWGREYYVVKLKFNNIAIIKKMLEEKEGKLLINLEFLLSLCYPVHKRIE